MSMAATTPMKWPVSQRHDDKLRCACCDREIKGRAKWVEVINGGCDVASPGLDPDTSDSGYMGFFAVGPTCAKKWFQGFTHESV